jgi:hypothetical protein
MAQMATSELSANHNPPSTEQVQANLFNAHVDQSDAVDVGVFFFCSLFFCCFGFRFLALLSVGLACTIAYAATLFWLHKAWQSFQDSTNHMLSLSVADRLCPLPTLRASSAGSFAFGMTPSHRSNPPT